MDTIFTRIIKGEISCVRVYEDEHTFAFMDIAPAARGHTLVISKEPYPQLTDVPADVLAAVAQTTKRVAQAIVLALHPDGFNIVQNNGAAAGQTVFHYHVHIIPRWQGDNALQHWQPGSSDAAELQELADQIRAQL